MHLDVRLLHVGVVEFMDGVDAIASRVATRVRAAIVCPSVEAWDLMSRGSLVRQGVVSTRSRRRSHACELNADE